MKQNYEFQPNKLEITNDFMMIIGKYLSSNKDYINIMKVNKKYEQLVLMYKFNPIGDVTLLENIQTQHFYKREDLEFKKYGMYQYIYWFKDVELMKNKKDNEIFKPINAYKYVVNNIPILEEWSGLEYHQILYDSDVDGKQSSTFKDKILNHQHLYFIVIDSNDNVFGHYHNGIIDKTVNIYDPNN
jgi:hypothetical protein